MNDDILVKHMEDYAAFQEETRRVHVEQSLFKAETEGTLAELSIKVDGLATRKDIEDLKKFMEQVNIGLGFFRFSWNNAGKLGSFLLLIAGVFVFFKVGFAGVAAWLAINNPLR